jgi:mannose-1-phosphate guanylyltransferase
MLHAVILAGGSGTRFWPRSRRDLPKQLLPLAGSRTLLQQTYDRLAELSASVVVVTREDLARGVSDQLQDLPREAVLIEPEARDTAAAIGLAATILAVKDPEALLAVAPSDHVIRPANRLRAALQEAAAIAAEPETIVTFGVRPSSPHTGYGYIERGQPLEHAGELSAFEVTRFTEKPDLATAESYLAGGQHAWNSGMFVASAKTFLGEMREHLPETHAALQRILSAWDTPERDAVLREAYASVPKVSIDYGILEKAKRVVVLEVDYEWSDVGGWSALSELFEGDAEQNVALEATLVAQDSRRCLVQGDGRLIALIGVEDLVVVQTRDATLVCPRDRAEEVKQLVARLEDEGHGAYV